MVVTPLPSCGSTLAKHYLARVTRRGIEPLYRELPNPHSAIGIEPTLYPTWLNIEDEKSSVLSSIRVKALIISDLNNYDATTNTRLTPFSREQHILKVRNLLCW